MNIKIINKLLVVFSLILLLIVPGCKKKHDCVLGEWIYPENYKCEDEIILIRKCTICDEVLDEKTETINHEFYEVELNETCTNDGYYQIKCYNCDYIDETKYEALGHNLYTYTKNATCSEAGYKETKCSRCDYYKKEDIAMLDHDYITKEISPTCTKEGSITITCSSCDYYKKETLNIVDHNIIIDEVPAKCNYNGYYEEKCTTCDYYKKEIYEAIGHDYIYEIVEPTCTEDGYYQESCNRCDYVWKNIKLATGHGTIEYVIEREATDELYGIKNKECLDCGEKIETIEYVNNGFSHHGKLSVNGRDLVDQYGEKFQLIGLSTHGLQWAGRYVNYDTFEALRNSFGMNVIRLSLYTSENGYCTGSDAQKEKLYNLVVDGITYATQLDMYVIIDWHMLGADDHGDENPLYYLEESMNFFDKITKQFPDNENLLFEIMNEPSGATTWQDCKDYANKVIPVIRKNNDGIVLVGNPKWSSDLKSVMKDPLVGYENIMYTYHFYAADHQDTASVINAYDKNIPVFITEHGGMESSGDGDMDFDSILNWHTILNQRNISYVAWNISNTKGSASILKTTSYTLTEFNSTTMKTWGVYYRAKVRIRFGLPT